MAAVCAQAIWTASARSISSLGAAVRSSQVQHSWQVRKYHPKGNGMRSQSLKTYPDAKARSVIETRRGYSLQLATRCAVSGPGLVSGGGTMNVSGRPVGETLKASSRCKRKI